MNIRNPHPAVILTTLAILLCGSTRADFHWADSALFQLDLLDVPFGSVGDYADSRAFNLDLYPVNRGWADSESFGLDTSTEIAISTIWVNPSAKYNTGTKLLTVTALAYDRVGGAGITSGQGSFEIVGAPVSGQMTWNGMLWAGQADLSAHPLAPGTHTVHVDIGGGLGYARFNIVAAAGQIAGTVRMVSGQTVSGVDVYLYRFGQTTAIGHDVTSETGAYSFTSLLPGWYKVEVLAVGYAAQTNNVMLQTGSGQVLDFVLGQAGTLEGLLGDMRQLKQSTLAAMNHQTQVMAEISGQAVGDLSASFDAWDVMSIIGGTTREISQELISDTVAKHGMETVIKTAFLNAVFKHLVKREIPDIAIMDAAKSLLPDLAHRNRWEHWDQSNLQGTDLWEAATGTIDNAETDFESAFPSTSVGSNFDVSKARGVIESQKAQLRDATGEQLVNIMVFADPVDGEYPLALPATSQTWKMDHALISLTGGVKKGAIIVQIGAGGTSLATGVATPVGAIASVIATGATAVKEVSAWANVAVKFHGALVYAGTAYGWAHDVAFLPMTYTTSGDFFLMEASNPVYLATGRRFGGTASLDLNAVGSILLPPPLMPMTFNNATVGVTNTSDIAAQFRVVPKGWWDYKLPGNVPWIGQLFGGVSNIKVPTVTGQPVSVSLQPGQSKNVSIPYSGWYIDPINMFSKHWLVADVYAGPFRVATVSKPYWVAKLSPVLMSAGEPRPLSGLAVSFQSEGKARLMSADDYSDMLPTVIALASGSVDANSPVIEVEHVVSTGAWSASFELMCESDAHVALQVYDEYGDCVGYDLERGGVLNEFVGSYTGIGAGPQTVEVPECPGRTFRVKAVLQGGHGEGPFDVQLYAFETPARPAVLAVLPEAVQTVSTWGSIFEIALSVGEGGHQQPLQDVSVTLSQLTGPGGATVPVYTATTVDLGAVAAGSATGVSFEVKIPDNAPVGDYTGQIEISSSNAGSVVIPVTITPDDTRQDLDGDGLVNMADYALLAAEWLDGGQTPADLDDSGEVDFADLARMAEQWLWQASWRQE